MEKSSTEIKNLKPGHYVLIDGIPCKVDKVQTSKAGKHGSAKARLFASGLFTDVKKIIVKPADTKMDVPIIQKKTVQILAFIGNNAQVMDLEDYSTSEVPFPDEFKGQLHEGDEVILWKFCNYTMIKGKK